MTLGVHIEAQITIHLHSEPSQHILDSIANLKETLVASNQDLLAALNLVNANVTDIGVEVDKIGTETTALQKSVADLTAALANGTTTPEVDAALAAVQAGVAGLASRVKAVDDLVPDSPVTP
jgi:hypothetical protein